MLCLASLALGLAAGAVVVSLTSLSLALDAWYETRRFLKDRARRRPEVEP
jgi:hypothetical protein